jgi:predicted secreted protein
MVLEKRVRALEANALRRSVNKDCTCRSGRKTYYHTAADVEAIMNVPCPVHGFRDLGDLLWVPPGTPILPEDRHLCSCPSCPTRDWLGGKRGPLTKAEQEKECRGWEAELTAPMAEELRIERARGKAILQTYFRNKRRHHG